MKKRGQVSIEFMVLIAFLTLIIISLLYASMYYTKEVENTISTTQLDRLVKEIVDSSEYVYYFGEPSKTTIKVFIPRNVKEITVGPNEINFRVKTLQGETDIFYRSSVNLSGRISNSHGFHLITIEAKEGYVWINST